MQTTDFLMWRNRLNTDAEYEALCHAGLEDTPQEFITESMWRRAMAGEIVIRKTTARYGPRLSNACALCGLTKQHRNWRFCRNCRLAEMKRGNLCRR